MEIKKYTVNKKTYEFINEYRNTANGFKHTTHLFIDDNEVVDVSVNYINRTWEKYTYQTSMLEAIYSAIKQRELRLEDVFRRRNNITRMTKDKREELERIKKDDVLLKEYQKVLKKLY